MGDFCKGALFGMAVGVCVGAVVVAKNKKLANKIKSCMQSTETKLMDAKDMIEEKIQEAEENSENSSLESDQKPANKKSKN